LEKAGAVVRFGATTQNFIHLGAGFTPELTELRDSPSVFGRGLMAFAAQRIARVTKNRGIEAR
jgi:hypothetical protein